MKKAIIFDVDGTAMPTGADFGLPSERLKQAMHTLLDHYYISTGTGRSLEYAKHIIEFLELTDPCIIAAGTEIYDPQQKKIIWREPIPVSTYDHIARVLANNHDQAFSGDNNADGYSGSNISGLLTGDTAVLYVIAVNALEATELTNALQHPELHIINMHSFQDQAKRDIHIHSAKASKEHAVNALLAMLKVRKEDSIVVGDGLNDLHLFVAGGTKVAMGNAVPELKAAADKVIKPIEEDGLAVFLESLANGTN